MDEKKDNIGLRIGIISAVIALFLGILYLKPEISLSGNIIITASYMIAEVFLSVSLVFFLIYLLGVGLDKAYNIHSHWKSYVDFYDVGIVLLILTAIWTVLLLLLIKLFFWLDSLIGANKITAYAFPVFVVLISIIMMRILWKKVNKSIENIMRECISKINKLIASMKKSMPQRMQILLRAVLVIFLGVTAIILAFIKLAYALVFLLVFIFIKIIYDLYKIKPVNEPKKFRKESAILFFLIFVICFFIYQFVQSSTEILPENLNKFFVIELIAVFLILFLMGWTIIQLLSEKINSRQYVLPTLISFSLIYLLTNYDLGRIWVYNGIVLFKGMHILALLVLLLYPFYLERYYEPTNWWAIGTILLIFVSLVIGFSFLDKTYGEHSVKSLEFRLHQDNKSETELSLDCASLFPNLFIGSEVRCTPNESVQIIESKVHFTSLLGEENTFNLTNYTFTILPDTVRVGIELWINDTTKNTTAYVYGDAQPVLKTKKEWKDNKEKFITYFLALIGVVLFSIPSMVSNFRKLSKRLIEKKK